MIEELKEKLERKPNKLQHELNVTLPQEIRKAVELGDLRENSEYKAALERQQFVQARLGSAAPAAEQAVADRRLADPARQGRARLARRREGRDRRAPTESYNLVFGDAVEFEEGHVTMSSPIGRALLGRRSATSSMPQASRADAPARDHRAQDHPRPAAPASTVMLSAG